MAKVIIFGNRDFAELAHYYLQHDSAHEVVAFSVHEAYLPAEKTFKGLPIVAFETVEMEFPPKEYHFFAPMSPQKMNTLRAEIYTQIKQKGYSCISYISSKATLFDNEIGENAFILENNTIQPFVKIGNNVVLWTGNTLAHHSLIGDHVSFASCVVLSGHCRVENHVFLGANATIKNGITLAEGTLVGMSANIVKHTEAWGIYVGNPAQKQAGKKSIEVL